MKTVRGDETTDSKRQFSMPSAGHRERLLKLVKYRWTRFAPRVLSKYEHLGQSKCALSYFSKGDSIFFSSRKETVLLDLYFLGLSPKKKKIKTMNLFG